MVWRLLLLALVTVARGEDTCLTGNDEPYLLFGEKTAYIFANTALPNQRVHDVPGCSPLAFWLLARPGASSLTVAETNNLQPLNDLKTNILENYARGQFRQFNQRVCNGDIELLKQWPGVPRNDTAAGQLTGQGYMDVKTLAQAWRSRYGTILTENKHDYMFKYVNDPLSTEAFRAFTEGLFRVQVTDVPSQNDEKTIRPHKSCPSWQNNVEKSNETLSQRFIFESKREYKEMITNISQRLGFSWDVDRDTIMRIYDFCRYSKAWDIEKVSIWCSAFSQDDLKRFEYAEDLETYYKYGYGSDRNQKMGCTPIKDLIQFFTTHVEREPPQQPRATIQIADAATVMLTLTALGAHRDSAPLTGDNYHTNTMQRREWRTSKLAPFNANLAAVLYKCTTNGNFQINEEYQVLFLENERPMNIENCRVGLCDWSHVKHLFGGIANQCDLQFCNGVSNVNGFFAVTLALIASFVMLVL